MCTPEFVLCKIENFQAIVNLFRKKNNPSDKDKTKQIIKDINKLLESPDFDRTFLCNHLLNKCIQLTQSEYGFIGVIRNFTSHDPVTNVPKNEKYLKTLAITNIAWNASSFGFYKNFVNDSFEFKNLDKTVFGKSILSKKPVIINSYNNENDILPPGHPPIRAFLGVPIVINHCVMVYVGMCNRLGCYSKKNVKMIENVLNIVGVTFYIMDKFNQEKSMSEIPTQRDGCPMTTRSENIEMDVVKSS